MALTFEELDGNYEVVANTTDGTTPATTSTGMTEIRNGLTYRKDSAGMIWESSFSIISPDQVQMESTIDPSHAGAAAFVKDEKGNLTKGMITYKATLDARQENDTLVLKGVICHGNETTELVMKKIK